MSLLRPLILLILAESPRTARSVGLEISIINSLRPLRTGYSDGLAENFVSRMHAIMLANDVDAQFTALGVNMKKRRVRVIIGDTSGKKTVPTLLYNG